MKPEEGEIYIHPTGADDLHDLLHLWNDGRVMRWVCFPEGLGYDLEMAKRWLEGIISSVNRHHFIIRDAGKAFCGELYYEVDRSHHIASLDIKLIPEAQGKGIATQALNILIDLVYRNEPDVQAVWVEPWPKNFAAQRLYNRCGLRPRSRPSHLKEGPSYWELTRREWVGG